MSVNKVLWSHLNPVLTLGPNHYAIACYLFAWILIHVWRKLSDNLISDSPVLARNIPCSKRYRYMMVCGLFSNTLVFFIYRYRSSHKNTLDFTLIHSQLSPKLLPKISTGWENRGGGKEGKWTLMASSTTATRSSMTMSTNISENSLATSFHTGIFKFYMINTRFNSFNVHDMGLRGWR